MNISPHEFFRARDRFHSLLAKATHEIEWQHFFGECPYVLSMSLPVRFEPSNLLTLGRPGMSEPDLMFFPTESSMIPYYGIIELKRHDSKILTATRANVVTFSRDAETAIQQTLAYSHASSSWLPSRSASRCLFLGNRAHLFIIMGSSDELITKLGVELHVQQVQNRLPGNVSLIPYDTLLRQFESHLPTRVYFLRLGDYVRARKLLVLCNLASYLGRQPTVRLADHLLSYVGTRQLPFEIVLFPTLVFLARIADQLAGSAIRVGAQGLAEATCAMIKDAGASYVFLGHADVRRNLGDTSAMVRDQTAECFRNDLIPVVCVTGAHKDLETDLLENSLVTELTESLELSLDGNHSSKLVVAYQAQRVIERLEKETVARTVALPTEVVSRRCTLIRSTLRTVYGSEAADSIRVVYGGGVDGANARDLIFAENLAGFLVGRASLQAQSLIPVLDTLVNEGAGTSAR